MRENTETYMLSKRKPNLEDSQEVRDLKKKTEYKFQCKKYGIIHERKSVLHMEKYVINVNYLIILQRCANQK